MDYKQFLDIARERFGLPYVIEKEKSGYFMMLDGEEAVGPDIGHGSCHSPDYGVTVNGWAYYYARGEWTLARDGVFSWRRGENPHPEIPSS